LTSTVTAFKRNEVTHQENNNMKTSKKSKKATTSKNGKKAVRFTLFDKSVTSVVRKLGKLGWTVSDATKAIHAKLPKVAPATISACINAGRKGKGAAPAELSKTELATLKRLAS
jgi:hypothetical protein